MVSVILSRETAIVNRYLGSEELVPFRISIATTGSDYGKEFSPERIVVVFPQIN